jgi:pheromone shutdown protein TraB
VAGVKGFFKNRITRTLLVFLFSTIGSAIGTFVGIPFLTSLLAGG